MAKPKTNKPTKKTVTEPDGVFFLKSAMYLIVGAQWVFLTDVAMTKQLPIPLGLVIGALFAAHDHFQIDRKIEFAILLVACLIGYWSQTGLLVSVLG